MALTTEWADAMKLEVRAILDGDYVIKERKTVPTHQDLSLGKEAIKVDLCAFSVDMRDSSQLLDEHQRQTAGKLHKAFLRAIAAGVQEGGGAIRTFNGDGLLAFWAATEQEEIQHVVEVAVDLTTILHHWLNDEFAKYRPIDFGIGIDHGPVYVLKAGIKGTSRDSDLVFIGPTVNYACRMAKQARSPRSVFASEKVMINLHEGQLYNDPDALIFNEPFWQETQIKHKGEYYKAWAREDVERSVVFTI